MSDRRCRTGEVLPSITKVFCPHQLHDMTISEGGAYRVGASCGFTPVASGNEVDASKSVRRPITERVANLSNSLASRRLESWASLAIASGAQRREGLTCKSLQRCQDSRIIERGVYIAGAPVVRNSSRITLNCRAVRSISDGEAMERLA